MPTTNAVATITSAELARDTTFSETQVDLIKSQIMPNASNEELMLFVQVASSRGLDPFRKHIYAVSRRSKFGNDWIDTWSYQVSIDGLRLIAQRSGRYRGQTPPMWCGPDGQWTDVWLADQPPAAAKVGVYIDGNPEPLVAIASYRTFCQKKSDGKPTKFWAEMPEHMLAKVAESQALRKAFPEEAGGLYSAEEMGQATNPERGYTVDHDTGEIVDGEVRPVAVDPKRDKVATDLKSLAKQLQWTPNTILAVVQHITGTDVLFDKMSTTDLEAAYRRLVTSDETERARLLDEVSPAAPVAEAQPA